VYISLYPILFVKNVLKCDNHRVFFTLNNKILQTLLLRGIDLWHRNTAYRSTALCTLHDIDTG